MPSFDINLTISQDQIDRVGNDIRAKLMTAINYCADMVATYARQNHLYQNRSHALTNSTGIQPAVQDGDEIFGLVTVGMPYALYVHWGTGIYAEGPGGSTAKKIPWIYRDMQGQFHITSGQHADKWVERAFQDKRDDVVTFLRGCL